MSEEQMPVEQVPPASRLGEIVGWSLIALAVTLIIAAIVAAHQADAWSQAMDHAHTAFSGAVVAHSGREAAAAADYIAADSAYREARVLSSLSATASLVFLSLIPGLLYAVKPSLLGGPLGRLLRPSSVRLAQRQPRRRRPVTFYQGIGIMLMGMPWIVQAVVTLPGMSFELVLGLGLLTVLLLIASILVGYPLLGQATWWLTNGRGAEHGQERPQA
ncbi:MAG: hypothetical protein ACXWQZ_18010 [Ktedonobacterales bacterium]